MKIINPKILNSLHPKDWEVEQLHIGKAKNRVIKIKNFFVNQGADAADDWIVNNIEPANICVTNDIPLAGRCLKKGAFVIKPNGNIYDTNNIGMALATRKIMEEKREKGEITRGPAPFNRADRSKFLNQMEMIVQKARKC